MYTTILTNISNSFTAMIGWELVAVILAVAYLLLIMRENKLGWLCAFVSTGIYIALFWKVSLLMESALNVYYMGMAIYGWWQWQSGGQQHQGVKVIRWDLDQHLITFAIIATLTLASGYLLSKNTEAAWPYVDSFTTWASVITTYMVAKKVLENWLYWIVINNIAIFLYIDRGLYLTAMLFVAYFVICIFGFFSWKNTYKNSLSQPTAATQGA